MRRFLLDAAISGGVTLLILAILIYVLFFRDEDRRSWIWGGRDYEDAVLEYYANVN